MREELNLIFKSQTINVDQDMEKLQPSYLSGGIEKIGQLLWEESSTPERLKIVSMSPLLGTHPWRITAGPQ
jgi:hypothetical protein